VGALPITAPFLQRSLSKKTALCQVSSGIWIGGCRISRNSRFGRKAALGHILVATIRRIRTATRCSHRINQSPRYSIQAQARTRCAEAALATSKATGQSES
jgi:hypothetical protein